VAGIVKGSGFSSGLNHVVDVLVGADTEKIRRWRHTALSTYGIGKEHTRKEWQHIGRELMRLGLLRQSEDLYRVLVLTPEGGAVLRERRPVTIVRPAKAPEYTKPRAGERACDEALFDRLRALRKELADARNVPAYVIFSDVTLREMARAYPRNEDELGDINGVGERKLDEFGALFLKAIEAHLQTNPHLRPRDPSSALPPHRQRKRARKSRRAALNGTAWDTLRRFREGGTIRQIARDRSLTPETIGAHLADALRTGEQVDVKRLFTKQEWTQLQAAFAADATINLTSVNRALGRTVDYVRLKIFRAWLQAEEKKR